MERDRPGACARAQHRHDRRLLPGDDEGLAPSTLNREAVGPFAAVIHHACDLDWRPYVRIRRFQETEPENVAAKPGDVDLLVANADATPSYTGKQRRHKAAYKQAFLELRRLRGMLLTDTCRLRRARISTSRAAASVSPSAGARQGDLAAAQCRARGHVRSRGARGEHRDFRKRKRLSLGIYPRSLEGNEVRLFLGSAAQARACPQLRHIRLATKWMAARKFRAVLS